MTNLRKPQMEGHQDKDAIPYDAARDALERTRGHLEHLDGRWWIRKAWKAKIGLPWVSEDVARDLIADLGLIQNGDSGRFYTFPPSLK